MKQFGDPRWVLETARKMREWAVEDSRSWGEAWRQTYFELGGQNQGSAIKGCPRSAAYGLWFLGRVEGAGRALREIPILAVDRRLGKNASYAELALRLLREGHDPEDLSALWKKVQSAYRQETGKEPARGQEGALDVAAGLFREGYISLG